MYVYQFVCLSIFSYSFYLFSSVYPSGHFSIFNRKPYTIYSYSTHTYNLRDS